MSTENATPNTLAEEKDQEVIELLSLGRPYREIEAQTGVSISTIVRRMRLPDFRAQVVAKRRERFRNLLGSVSEAAPAVVKELVEISRGVSAEGGAPPSISDRLRACEVILRSYLRMMKEGETQDILEDMQSKLDGLGDGQVAARV